MTKRFECSMCGICCRFSNKSDEHLTWLRSRIAAGRGPVYYFASIEDLGPPIFSWESEKLSEIEPRFSQTPRTFVYDLKNEMPLVTSYSLNEGVCVFLGNKNRCTAYENRPLLCRSFPLVKSGIGKSELDFWRYECCPNAFDVKLPELMTGREYADLMEDSYGEAFLWAVARDAAKSWLNQNVLEAEKEGFTKMIKDIPQDEALRVVGERSPMDFFEYLIEVKPDFARDFEEMTDNFYSLDYVRTLLDNIL